MESFEIRVLLIDDSPSDALLIAEFLEDAKPPRFAIEHCESLGEGLARFDAGSFDVVLLDLTLPDSRGAETFRRACRHAPGATIVVLSELDDEQIAVQAVQDGAQDYLVKGDIDTDVLSRSLRYAIERKRTQRALEKARDAAESANRAKSAFLATMSHEIRTPMNAILGMTELVLETQLSAEQREYLELAHSAAENLLTVINDVLDYSKIEAGKVELDPAPFDLARLLGSVMKTLATGAHAKGLELIYEIAPGTPTGLIGDETRLRQIVMNLVGNAIKFTHDGEVALSVAPAPRESLDASSDDEEEIRLRFSVSDTGIGIPDERREAIFSAFEQADSTTTRRYGGTGLGLAIVSRLVALMGGELELESAEGRGSRFSFTAAFRPAETGAQPTPGGADPLEGVRALVIEDNATARRVIADALDSWGMAPEAVGAAEEALHALQQAADSDDPFAVAVIDGRLPEGGGPALAEQIKKRFPRVAVVLTVPCDGAGAALREAPGVDVWLRKPVDPAELFNALAEALKVEPEGDDRLEDGPTGQVRCLRILVAEDNLINQRLVWRLLSRRGHEVAMANHGREAVSLAACEPFDLALMDVQMPKMDGLEATRAIRDSETNGHRLPIVAVTAHAMKGDRERCLAAGMDGYVAKPLRSRELFAEIERVLSLSQEPCLCGI